MNQVLSHFQRYLRRFSVIHCRDPTAEAHLASHREPQNLQPVQRCGAILDLGLSENRVPQAIRWIFITFVLKKKLKNDNLGHKQFSDTPISND